MLSGFILVLVRICSQVSSAQMEFALKWVKTKNPYHWFSRAFVILKLSFSICGPVTFCSLPKTCSCLMSHLSISYFKWLGRNCCCFPHYSKKKEKADIWTEFGDDLLSTAINTSSHLDLTESSETTILTVFILQR